ncbi:sushi, von Willebrand factor type A, EGF and pentraxin domain-containing protein 1-like isoform X2 [Ruditapes philippinarum]|uniref:sushi, von Willebrand factor type A, EGF and pentraxin domain-containing protein 1-like isoform X2 n=1 Tax=Ruditapes philippinarum TaxID=129788 RepID=UPI00295AE6A2|nr:sushi, von Willebrand factor type A, EGF and pentraxin domain-containing protein 1-like isoform X2 [Ruditapes philippinarum]
MHRSFSICLILTLVYFIIGLYNDEVRAEDVAAMETIKQTNIEVDDIGCIPPSEMDCDEDIVDMFVPAGTLCFPVNEAGPNLICINGEWVEAISVAKSDREKRSHAVCTTHRSRRRSRWRRRRRRSPYQTCISPNHGPQFTKCPSSLTFYAPSKKTEAVVSWEVPVATDIEDGKLSVTQTSGPKNGGILDGDPNGRKYYVYYKSAGDTGGLTATCKIEIIVKVIICPIPSAPKFGTIDCSGTYYGHSCVFACVIGYGPTITGMMCQMNGQWTNGGSSECRGVSCPQSTPTIEHGHYSCSTFTVGTTCNPTCDQGYSVFKFYPITCKNDGQWSLPVGTICKDSDPPTLSNCPSNIMISSDKGDTSAVVTWEVPSASDNQDATSPSVIQTAGSILPGTRVESGVVYTVKYVAFDSAGNPSEECSFNVQVKTTKCSSISAPHYGYYQCDKGFIYGSQCSYSCYKGYLLQGATLATCDQNGVWSSSAPTCKEIECLQPDQYGINLSNGYFSCPSPITYQSACYPVCNSGFELAQYATAICIVDLNNNPSLSLSLQPECLDNEPPTFNDCVGTKVLTFPAAKGKTTAVIQYDIPTASDNVDPSPEVIKIRGPDSGDTVDASDIEYVEFQAMDDVGNVSPLCLYVLQVDVTECPAYIPPDNAEVSCTSDYIYGSICTLTCKIGYESQSSAVVQCLEDGSWNATNFECSKVLCPSVPTPPDNGFYSCAANTFPYGTICQAICNEGFALSQMSFARCTFDGTWEISTTPDCIDAEPPVIIDCPSEIKINAERGLESAIVTWTVSSANDNFDNSPSVMRVYGPNSGERIEDSAIVKYQATDSAGNPSDICTIYITVTVIRCTSPYWPDDGRMSCDLGNIYGSECTYTCDEGYEVSFPSTTVCEEDGSWSYGGQPPSCSPITCGPPPSVLYGTFACIDIMYRYESLCILECASGYSTDSAVYAICQSSGEWHISSNSSCKDIVPPTLLNCKTYQTFYTDRGLDTAQVTWSIPTAIDNTDNPSDIIIEQLSGPTIGSSINIGTTVVDYRAVDTSGNPSIVTCSITINVEAVYCNHPKYYFDDVNLEYTCTSFNWGDTCSLACPLKDSLNLEGPDLITCEATFSGSSPVTTWEYEGNVVPFCEGESCAESLYIKYTRF